MGPCPGATRAHCPTVTAADSGTFAYPRMRSPNEGPRRRQVWVTSAARGSSEAPPPSARSAATAWHCPLPRLAGTYHGAQEGGMLLPEIPRSRGQQFSGPLTATVAVESNKKPLNETEICDRYITPAIDRGLGGRPSQWRREFGFTDGKIIVRGKLVARGKRKRADYLLFHKPNLPIAVDRGEGQQPLGRRRDAAGARLRRDASTCPFVFSSNGDGFLFHDRTGTLAPGRAARCRSTSSRRPDELWGRYQSVEGPRRRGREARQLRLLTRTRRQGAALLPAARHQPHHRGRRRGPAARPARDGHRHRQDLHGVPDHLAALEGGHGEARAVPRRPQHPR